MTKTHSTKPDPIRILLTGARGQLGWELERSLQAMGRIWAPTHQEFDLSKPESLREKVRAFRPQIIVNPAAYTAVDNAEKDVDLAMRINAEAPGVLAEEALHLDALLIHFSTDYVFDGSSKIPYTESDLPKPINVYGQTKLAGEENIRSTECDHLIFRTAWVYAARRQNFLRTMQRLMSERDSLNVVADQKGSPTWARSLAEATTLALHQCQLEKPSTDFQSETLHLVSGGYSTWYEFAIEIRNNLLTTCELNPISTSEYPTPAERPANSMLDTRRFQDRFGLHMSEWRDSLKLCMAEVP